MRILVCGDRNFSKYTYMEKIIKNLSKDTIIIHGGCRGADKIAGIIAQKREMKVIVFPAEWKKYGKKAGPLRNKKMLVDGKPDLILAFHNNLDNSKGTKNMINLASKAGVNVIVYDKY